MKRTLAAMISAAVLAACGGGGGNPGSTAGANDTPQPPATPTQQLAGYVGTWVADCAGREQETDTITQLSPTAISVAVQTNYFAGANCTGGIIATRTQSSAVTATSTGTADVSVVLPPATTPSTIKADLVTATLSPYTVSVTGPGVTRTTPGGQPSWAVNFAPGDVLYIPDEGTLPGSTTNSALYVSGNQLYELTQSGLTYTISQHLVKAQ